MLKPTLTAGLLALAVGGAALAPRLVRLHPETAVATPGPSVDATAPPAPIPELGTSEEAPLAAPHATSGLIPEATEPDATPALVLPAVEPTVHAWEGCGPCGMG